MEKAQTLHDKVMKLLVRRYVTAEQRRRDDYGITEDDIIEVRQDISSLRFELLEIFTNNSWEVPDIEKKTQGKKQVQQHVDRLSHPLLLLQRHAPPRERSWNVVF